jgi:hypothetical protein
MDVPGYGGNIVYAYSPGRGRVVQGFPGPGFTLRFEFSSEGVQGAAYRELLRQPGGLGAVATVDRDTPRFIDVRFFCRVPPWR